MIELRLDQNLFDTTADAIVNTVNVVGVMGKGIALKFKELYPDMFHEYKEKCDNNEIKIGKLYLYEALDKRKIINFPTKTSWRKKSEIDYVVKGLRFFVNNYKSYNITSIAFPPLGCGNGGLDWKVVKKQMYRYLGDLDLDVEIYVSSELENPQPNSNKPIEIDNYV